MTFCPALHGIWRSGVRRGTRASGAYLPQRNGASGGADMSTTAVRTIRHRIGGEETSGESTRTSVVWDPATGQQQAEVVLAEAADVDAAVKAAQAAFPAWSETSVTRRSKIMFAFRNLVDQHLDELARLVASEHGKVVEDAKGELIRGLEVVEFACGIPQLLKGEYS